MNEKPAWRPGTAHLNGGGLDALMILATLERLEEKIGALNESIRSKRSKRRDIEPLLSTGTGTKDPCGPAGGEIQCRAI